MHWVPDCYSMALNVAFAEMRYVSPDSPRFSIVIAPCVRGRTFMSCPRMARLSVSSARAAC